MKRISLLDAVDAISKKYLGYDTVTFFERWRDGLRVNCSLDRIGFFLTDIASLVYEFEQEKIAEIKKLKEENEKLRRLLNKNPTNSHKPPSSDRNRKIKNSRIKTNKLTGGQVGHEGTCNELHDCPDQVFRNEPQKCSKCNTNLKNVAEDEVIRKKLIDVRDGKMHITECQIVIKFCPNCGQWMRGEVPIELQKSRIIFGHNVKAIAVYLMVQKLLPLSRTQEILSDLFGISISQGALCNFLHRYGDLLKDWESEIKIDLLNSELNHVDETSVRYDKKSHWVHVISDDEQTLLNFHSQRGKDAIDEIGVLPEYNGHLVHDAFSAYWNYGESHSLCNAHILRELKYLHVEDGQAWALEMSNYLQTTLHAMHGGKKITAKWRKKVKDEFIIIMKALPGQAPGYPSPSPI